MEKKKNRKKATADKKGHKRKKLSTMPSNTLASHSKKCMWEGKKTEISPRPRTTNLGKAIGSGDRDLVKTNGATGRYRKKIPKGRGKKVWSKGRETEESTKPNQTNEKLKTNRPGKKSSPCKRERGDSINLLSLDLQNHERTG